MIKMKENLLLLELDGSHIVYFYMFEISILYYFKMLVPGSYLRATELEYLRI